MEDVVAVRVELDSGESRFFVTWGRIQDKVDPEPLEQLVMRHASGVDLGGEAISAHVCDSLREARDERYFFEALVSFGQARIPFGDGYAGWRDDMRASMDSGRELYYLGRWPG